MLGPRRVAGQWNASAGGVSVWISVSDPKQTLVNHGIICNIPVQVFECTNVRSSLSHQRTHSLDGMDAFIERAMAEWHIPGLAIAVIRTGDPAVLKTFGWRDKNAGLPVTTDTLFPICSLTKSFTATGLAMLADAGRLDWDKPVRDYVPELCLYDHDTTERVTVRDLLLHRTGLPRHDWVHMPGILDRMGLVSALRYLEPTAELRAKWQYQNLMYNLAGVVAERISGKSWEDFTRAAILKPLSMERHAFSLQAMQEDRDHARPYMVLDGALQEIPVRPIHTIPSGGLAASIGAMACYLHMHLDSGCFEGQQLLSLSTSKLMQSPQIYVGASPWAELGEVHYGLGFDVLQYRRDKRVSHGGAWSGYCSALVMLPERKMGVVVLTNGHDHAVGPAIASTVFDRLRGRDELPWIQRLSDMRCKALQEDERHRAAWLQARKPGTHPSHPAADYAGNYEHPAYGRISIAVEEGQLRFHGLGMTSLLTHWHYDVFMTDADPTIWLDGWPVLFQYGNTGQIDRLMIQLESSLPGIVFTQSPPV